VNVQENDEVMQLVPFNNTANNRKNKTFRKGSRIQGKYVQRILSVLK
jgi:hypothetical protein